MDSYVYLSVLNAYHRLEDVAHLRTQASRTWAVGEASVEVSTGMRWNAHATIAGVTWAVIDNGFREQVTRYLDCRLPRLLCH
jgi:hypothetical protein